MGGFESIGLALVLLGLLWASGWSLLRHLSASGIPGDAAVALMPVVGLTAFAAIAAAAVPLMPDRPALAAALGLPLVGVLFPVRRHALTDGSFEKRRIAAPLPLIALVAVVAASAPSLAHRDGAASTWGNADPYLWVSEAKAFLSGPAPQPNSFFPDRLAYERLSGNGWAPGLPGLTAVAAEIAREDPVEAFGAVAALLFVLTPLVTFAITRVALGWSQRLSFTASLLVALSPYQLFSSYYGWQPQISGIACALAAILMFRLALENRLERRRLLFFAALLIAGALGIYRLPFLPYLVFLLALVAAGFWLAHRSQASAALRIVVGSLVTLGCMSAALAAPSLLAFAHHGDTFWAQQSDTASWQHYLRALPSDALGLVPRLPDLDHGVALGWRVLALAMAVAIIVRGFKSLFASTGNYRDLVLALTFGSLLAVAIAQLRFFTPYYSIKLMAYGSVPLILTALAPLRGRGRPSPLLAAAGALVLTSLATVIALGATGTNDASDFASLSSAVARVPDSAVVDIRSRNTWDQMWTIYYARNHRTSVAHPSDYLTGLGLQMSAETFRHPATFVIPSGNVIQVTPIRRLAAAGTD